MLGIQGKRFVKFTPEVIERYMRAGYRLVGRNTAIEVCRWTKSALRGEWNCYKRWYGISSHRCIQMTPNLNFCNFACDFCWRIHEINRFKTDGLWDDPREIVSGIIWAQRDLLMGFKGNPKVSRERFLEAMFPRHVAISLDGEPTMYPKIDELIMEVKSKGMTAFLVTNGSLPHRIKKLIGNAEPTNLYISVYGPDEKTFTKTAKPLIKDAWSRLLESLSLMRKFKNRTVFRMTLVKGLNMQNSRGYSKLIEKSEPKFIELKGYTWTGESMKRLPKSAMPRMEELEDFAKEISKWTGYSIKVKDMKSRVIMLVKDEETWLWNLSEIKKQKEQEMAFDNIWKETIKDFKLKNPPKIAYY